MSLCVIKYSEPTVTMAVFSFPPHFVVIMNLLL